MPKSIAVVAGAVEVMPIDAKHFTATTNDSRTTTCTRMIGCRKSKRANSIEMIYFRFVPESRQTQLNRTINIDTK